MGWRLGYVLVLAWAMGCGGGDEDVRGSAVGASCATPNQTQACMCDSSAGRQVCTQAGWGECECDGVNVDLTAGQAGHAGPAPAGNLRTDINFDWQETSAAAGPCQAGEYVGTFECQFESMPVMPMGPVTMRLEASADGEFLEVRDGIIDAQTMGPMLHADLEGQLDCTNRRFEARMLNGMAAIIPGLPFNTFEGTLSGDYEPTTATITGEWHIVTSQGWMCPGTWSVALTP